jgi:KTSC domain
LTSFASKKKARARKAPDSRMQRVPVESSNVASIGYAPQERVLELEFRQSGEVYHYFDVPAEEYTAFLAADSKGTYVNQHLNLGDIATSGSRPHLQSRRGSLKSFLAS